MSYMIMHPSGRTEPANAKEIRARFHGGRYTSATRCHRIKWPDELNPFIRRDYYSLRAFPEFADLLPPESQSRPQPESPSYVPPASSQSSVGAVLTLLGILTAAYFFFAYDTSVRTESRYIAGVGTIPSESVHNLGLMQNRQLGCIAGMVIAVVGVGVCLFAAKKPSHDIRNA